MNIPNILKDLERIKEEAYLETCKKGQKTGTDTRAKKYWRGFRGGLVWPRIQWCAV